jgi:hypothetical protein
MSMTRNPYNLPRLNHNGIGCIQTILMAISCFLVALACYASGGIIK